MRRRSQARRIAATIIAVLLTVLLVKLFGNSFWAILLFFVLSLLAGDFIAEFLENRGWLGRHRK